MGDLFICIPYFALLVRDGEVRASDVAVLRADLIRDHLVFLLLNGRLASGAVCQPCKYSDQLNVERAHLDWSPPPIRC